MITIKEVAEYADVSIATVSRYYKDSTLLKAKTREIVENAINTLGYIPNTVASMLKSNHTDVYGILISDISNVFFNSLINKLNRSLNAIGKHLFVFYDDPNIPFDKQLSTIMSFKMDALFFMPKQVDSPNVVNLLKRKSFYALQLFIDYYSFIDSLTIDDMQGCFIGTEELLKNNHSKIMLIDINNIVHEHRKAGFIKALSAYNVPFDDKMVFALSDSSFESQLETINSAIKAYGPTAIISTTNNLTQLVVYLLRQNNLKIGKDISLIMYDESEWARLENITTISQSIDDISNNILSIINSRIDNNSSDNDLRKIVITPKLEKRLSVNPLK